VLMEPEKRGFNLAGWYMPFVALGGGTALVIALLRRWRHPAPAGDPERVAELPVNATTDELARLDQLVHRDDA